jgi:Peptidase inhibitor family I36
MPGRVRLEQVSHPARAYLTVTHVSLDTLRVPTLERGLEPTIWGVMRFKKLRQLALVMTMPLLLADAAHAASDPGDSQIAEVQATLAEQLREVPGGTVEGNRILYADGSYFAAVEAGTLSIGQCDSGYFCGWAQSNYTGSFFAVSGAGVTRNLTWSTRSYRNRRTTTAKLFNNSGTASTCFAVNETRATVGSAYHSPAKVRLTTKGSC